MPCEPHRHVVPALMQDEHRQQRRDRFPCECPTERHPRDGAGDEEQHELAPGRLPSHVARGESVLEGGEITLRVLRLRTACGQMERPGGNACTAARAPREAECGES